MIGKDKVFIIAEAGVNHNGSKELAMELIRAAKETGADAIKFQTWKTENVIAKDSPKAPYQDECMGEELSQFDMLKHLELPYGDFICLKKFCDEIGISFMSTADEWESAQFLNEIVDIFKVGSAELTDAPFLAKLASLQKEIILSTGMGDLDEVKDAVAILKKCGMKHEDIHVLHAHTEYPSEYRDLNLKAIVTLEKELGLSVGYSDHSKGIEAPIAAVALGARIIEKHFTLDCKMEGPDHMASADPKQFTQMVKAIRNIEQAMGDGIKKPSQTELKNIPYIRKSIVAKRDIAEGEILTEDNITVKRPENGITPMRFREVLGTRAIKAFHEDEPISL